MKIEVEFDTDTQALVVRENGVVLDAVSAVSFYERYRANDDDPKRFSMNLSQESKIGNVSKCVHTIAQYFGATYAD